MIRCVPGQLLENKEEAYMDLLKKKLSEAGYSIAPASFTPVEPPTAAEANAATQAEAETAVFTAEAAAEVARAEYEANLGGPGEAGAAVRLQAAEAALAAAEREVTDAREARAAAAEAAAAAPQLLEQYDVVVWKPRKKMTVRAFPFYLFSFSCFLHICSHVLYLFCNSPCAAGGTCELACRQPVPASTQ